MKSSLGKLLYGLAFSVLLPAILFGWAVVLDGKYPLLPPVGGMALGLALIVSGGALVGQGVGELWLLGGGLPMNAFPPERYVARGLYAWIPHPIYLGFAVLMLGLFIAARMPAGVWIVSPVLWLGTAALVIGYERIDLQRRFGRVRPLPRFALPPAVTAAPEWWHRAAAYLLVIGPWYLAYEAIALVLTGQRGWETYLPFEYSWPTLPLSTALYLAAYGWVLLSPLAASSQVELRRFVRDGWAGAAFIFWCFLVLPLTATPRFVDQAGWLGRLLGFDRAHDTSFCAFPSFHVFWPLLAARLWSGRMGAPLAYGLAAMMAASCLTTGMHSLLDVVAGLGVFALINRTDDLWRWLLRTTEGVANSWRDWRIGGMRIINHGAYVALAAGSGAWLVGWLLGEKYTTSIVITTLCSLIGAGIWAQVLESSSGLSRPFGYYGGIFGGCLGVLAMQLWRAEGWMLFAAFSTAAPIIQGAGRLRCLVQGCCHGRPSPDNLGIRYHHPLSRVCKLAQWSGTPVYPTPLYSMIGNGVIFGLVLRLWFGGADLGMISGTYLILSAAARFMEEGYRGEPQTMRAGGLAIYQWLALLFVAAGMLCMAYPTPPAPPVNPDALYPLSYAVPFGLLVWFAMGVDFPESTRRFSRLA